MPLFTLTSAAVGFYKKQLKGNVLKLNTKTGCSGNKLILEAVSAEEIPEAYQYLEQDDIKMAYDPAPAIKDFLDGLVIDFEESIMGSKIVFKNPSAESQCGCGQSWKK